MKAKKLTKVISVMLSAIMLLSTTQVGLTAFASEVQATETTQTSTKPIMSETIELEPEVIEEEPEVLVEEEVASSSAKKPNKDENVGAQAPEPVGDISCSFNEEDGVLTISGSGAMQNYNGSNMPWYSYRDKIKTVVIEDGITSIGNDAFYNCNNLTSVTIPDSVTIIGSEAFYKCALLESIKIPDSVTSVGSYAFQNCTSLKNVEMSKNVKAYAYSVFSGCKSLESIEIADGVTSIGNDAFKNCENLTSVTIPDSVTTVGSYAFQGCTSLKNVEMSKNVKVYSSYLFYGCTSLESIEIADGVTTIGGYAFANTAIKTITIPNSVTSISNYAFSGLTDLTIKATIGSYAKLYCDRNDIAFESTGVINYEGSCGKNATYFLDTVNGVFTVSGSGAMQNYYNLYKPWQLYRDYIKTVVIEDGITSIAHYTFNDHKYLTSVTIPDSVTTVGDYAFQNCTLLESIKIPDSVTTVGDYAFSKTAIKTITIPNSVTNIGNSAFHGLKDLTIKAMIGSYAKLYCDRYNIAFESTGVINYEGECGENATYFLDSVNGELTISGSGAMQNYNGSDMLWQLYSDYIKTVVIEDGITSIGRNIFNDHKYLTSVTIPDSVTTVGSYAFQSCTSLESITIPDSVTTVGSYAFQYCTSLKNVEMSKNVKVYSSNLFQDCKSLESIEIADGVTTIDSYAFSNTAIKTITIPDSVTTIKEYAFYICTLLESIKISDSVKSIGFNVFYGCTGLTSITIPDSVTSIGSSAFDGCTGLTSITIPDSVTSIGSSAFSRCTGLTSITIPDSVTSIGGYAFSGCTGLTSITIPDSVTSIESGAFSRCTGLTTITIPDSVTSIDYYAFGGCTGLTSITIPNSVTSIGSSAFDGCTGLTSITIPNSVTSIGSYAFSGCTGLTSITIPDSVTSIGSSAFSRCTGLKAAVIPNSETSIGNSAFANCPALTIFGVYDSFAFEYAYNNNIEFSSLYGTGEGLLVASFEGEKNAYRDMQLKLYADDDTVYIRKITESNVQNIYGIDESKTYTAEIIRSDGFVFEKIENIKFTDKLAEITFSSKNKPQSAKVVVLDEKGVEITEGFSVKWTYSADGKLISKNRSIDKLCVGEKINCQVILGDGLIKEYTSPQTVSFTVDEDNNISISLEKIASYKTTVKVVNKDGITLEYADVRFIQRFENGVEQITNRITDDNGYVTADLKAVETEIIASDSGYFDSVWTGVISSDKSIELVLNELSGPKIYYNITAKKIGIDTYLQIDTSSISFSLFNVTKNVELNDIFVQSGKIYITDNRLSDGDELRLSLKDNNKIYADKAITFKYSATQRNFVEPIILEKGSIQLSVLATENKSNVALLFDADGKFVRSIILEYNMSFTGLDAGEYTVVVAGANDYTNSVSSLDKLEKYGLKEKTDYLKLSVSVKDGNCTKINNISVPKPDVTKLSYLDVDNSRVTTNISSVALGNYFVLKTEYSFKSDYSDMVSNQKVIIDIPANCQFLDDSITIDGIETSDYEVFDGYIEVTTNKSSGIVRCCLININSAESVSISSSIAFDFDGNSFEQPIGSAKMKFSELEFYVTSKTASKNIYAWGNTLKNSKIEVYDNGVMVAEDVSNDNGYFKVYFELNNAYLMSTHNIYVVITKPDGLVFKSQTEVVEHSIGNTMPSKINCYGSMWDDWSVDLLNGGGEAVYFTLVATENEVLTYCVEFQGDINNVDCVYVVTKNHGGSFTKVPTVFDKEKNCFVGSFVYSTSAYPESISVEYSLKEEKLMFDADALKDEADDLFDAGVEKAIDFIESSAENGETFSAYIDSNGLRCIELKVSEDIYCIFRTNDEYTYQQVDYYTAGTFLYSQITEEFDGKLDVEDVNPIYEINEDGSSDISNKSYYVEDNSFVYVDGDCNLKVSTNFSDLYLDTLEEMALAYNQNSSNESVKMFSASPEYGVNLKADRIRGDIGLYEVLSGDDFALKAIADYNVQMDKLEECIAKKGGSLDDYGINKGEYKTALTLAAVASLGNLALNIAGGLSGYLVSVVCNWLCRSLDLSDPWGSVAGGVYDFSVNTSKDYAKNYKDFAFGMLYDLALQPAKKTIERMIDDLKASAQECEDKKVPKYSSSSIELRAYIDPSGYVYEGVASNRVEGVTCTVYYSPSPDGSNAVMWDAEKAGQQNPLITDEYGRYEWFVPEGWWQVKYEKEGYLTTYSDWLPVPPPQTEVNIAITSLSAPKVESVYAYNDQVQINFDQYINIYTVTNENVKITMDGKEVSGKIKPLNAEKGENQAIEYATEFLFTPDTQLTSKVNVSISNIRNYADSMLEGTFESTYDVVIRPTAINLESEYNVEYGGSQKIEFTITPAEAAANKKVFVSSNSDYVVSVKSTEVITDENGKATVIVNGSLPGSAELTFTLENSALSAKTVVNSVMPEVETVEPVTASIESKTEVNKGTTVTLSTETKGAEIYYTTDLSCPCIVDSPSRIKYTGPITINEDSYIIAYAVKDGMEDSKTTLFIYEVNDVVETVPVTTVPVTTVPVTTVPVTTVPVTTVPVTTVPVTTVPVTTVPPTTIPVSIPREQILVGDVNLDGRVTIYDATLIQKYIVERTSFNECQLLAADCDFDGKISIKDASCIQKYVIEITNCGYVGQYLVHIEQPTTEPTTIVVVTQPATTIPVTTKPVVTQPVTTVPVTTVPVTTQPVTVPDNNYTVTFNNAQNWSGTIYCYYWINGNSGPVTWPGTAMKYVSGSTYTVSIPKSANYLIFTNNGEQTVDIPFNGTQLSFYAKAETDSSGHSYYGTGTPASTKTVTFTNSLKWGGTIYCYYWTNGSAGPLAWPGKAMNYKETNGYGESTYTVDIPNNADYAIFTNGSNQTVDISLNNTSMKFYAKPEVDSSNHHYYGTW